MRRIMTDAEINETAEKIAETISIRSTVRGNSLDVRRDTAAAEYDVLLHITKGALTALNREDVLKENSPYDTKTHAILTTAECIFAAFFKDIINDEKGDTYANSYDSIYIPLFRAVYQQSAERGSGQHHE